MIESRTPRGAADALADERRVERAPRGLATACGAGRHADAHERGAGLGHHRAHVGEVEVDDAGARDQVADALHALAQDVVGHAEGVDHRDAAVEHLEQAVVGDDDERVDLLCSAARPAWAASVRRRALERERHRDDADGQRAELARGPRDHGCGAGARAAALAGRHEDEIGAAQHVAQASI